MRNMILMVAMLMGIGFSATAQYNVRENDVWVFGSHAKVDFSSGVPVSDSAALNVIEGSASISNSVGQLLFSTDGKTVYNKMEVVMSGGSSIVPFFTGSSIQNSVIVPFPSDTNKYYLFSVEERETGALYSPDSFCRFGCSVIDMTLDGGLGGVVPGMAGIILEDSMCEKVMAVPGSNCNVWVLTHKRTDNTFVVYEITNAGISAPNRYTAGYLTGATLDLGMVDAYLLGALNASHDGRTLVIASQGHGWSSPLTELCDFDPATGVVSNCRVIDSAHAGYGAEFSVDGTKLYVVDYTIPSKVVQYDISLPTAAAIQASRIDVPGAGLGTTLRQLRMARDGMIYVPHNDHLDRITAPNNSAATCGYSHGAVALAPGFGEFGLPNEAVVARMATISGPSGICAGTSYTYTATGMAGHWANTNPLVAAIDGTTGVLTAIGPGVDTIRYLTTSCDPQIVITVYANPSPLLDIMPICEGRTLQLMNPVAGGSWSSSDETIATIGDSTGIATGLSVGSVSITYSIGPCISVGTLHVLPAPPLVAGATTVCIDDTTMLSHSVPGGYWISDNPAVADVDYWTGKAYGISTGTALISYVVPGYTCPAIHALNIDCELSVTNVVGPGEVHVYPTLFTNYLKIWSRAPMVGKSRVSISDMLGRAVFSAIITGDDVTLSVPAIAPGAYVLRLYDEQERLVAFRRLLRQ